MNQLTVHTNSPHTYAVCRFPDSIWMHRRYYNRDEISTTPSFFPAAFPVRTYLPEKCVVGPMKLKILMNNLPSTANASIQPIHNSVYCQKCELIDTGL